MSISQLLIKNSGWTWDRLRESRNLGYQIGEESMTDFLILNLKKYGAGKLLVKSFTRHAESTNGADWEWWLTGPSGAWIGMRIQAKIINLQSEKFEHLHHKNRHGAQVDLLLSDASRHQLIPLYCMYCNWDPKKYKTPRKCLTYKPSVRHYGNSILGASFVKELQKNNKKHLVSIINHLLPMHCIFGSKGHSLKGDLPVRAFKYLKANGLAKMYENQESSLAKILLKKEVPTYVNHLLEASHPEIIESSTENSNEDFDLGIVDDIRLKRVTILKEIQD